MTFVAYTFKEYTLRRATSWKFTIMTTERNALRRSLEEALGRPLDLGELLRSIREGEEWSQVEMARRLGVSRSHLCDLEKRRKTVSPARAARYARMLGYSEAQFVRLSLQSLVDEAGLAFEVQVTAA